MLCDCCHKKESVMFLEQISSSGKIKLNLCMDCAVKYGISLDPKTVEKSVNSLFSDFSEKSRVMSQESSELCPVCAQSLYNIKYSGLAGCPECYEIFASQIRERLQNKGMTAAYTGSMPSRLRSFRSHLTDRMDLQAKLDASVKDENYEKAAMYRDYLRALERQSVSDGSDVPDNPMASSTGGSNDESKS